MTKMRGVNSVKYIYLLERYKMYKDDQLTVGHYVADLWSVYWRLAVCGRMHETVLNVSGLINYETESCVFNDDLSAVDVT
jgi:hypothetical protein